MRPGRHHKGLLWCLLPLLSPSTGRASWCEDLWRKKNLVPASSKDYYKLIPISGQGRTGKHSGGILTQKVRALSVYNSGKGWLTGQGVTGVSCD